MNFLKRVCSLLSLLVLIIFYQNCAPQGFATIPLQLSNASGDSQSSNNDDNINDNEDPDDDETTDPQSPSPSPSPPPVSGGGGNNSGGTSPGGAVGFPLAAGHFVPSQVTMEIIAPREGLTTANRYYKAYPGILYRVPIVVLGGAWPFRYRITSTTPSGMTIGSNYGEKDYGILNWVAPQTPGTYNVTVRVEDQQLTYRDVSWSIQVTTSGFVFVDSANGDDSISDAAMSRSNPFRTFGRVLNGNFTNHFVYMRTGTYETASARVDNYSTVAMGGKPKVWMAYPNATATGFEAVTFDMRAGSFAFGGSLPTNLWMSNLNITPRPWLNNASSVAKWDANGSDIMVFENRFSAPGGNGGENASLFYSSNHNNATDFTRYFAMVGNQFNGTNKSDLFLAYFTYKCVFENNEIIANDWHGFYAKFASTYWSVRNNRGLPKVINGVRTENSGSLVNVSDYTGNASGDAYHGAATYFDITWNNYRSSGSGVDFGLGNSTAPVGYIFLGRNTWQVGDHRVNIRNVNPLNVNADVMQFTNSSANTHGWIFENGASITGSFQNEQLVGRGTNFVNTEGILIDQRHLGLIGHQVR